MRADRLRVAHAPLVTPAAPIQNKHEHTALPESGTLTYRLPNSVNISTPSKTTTTIAIDKVEFVEIKKDIIKTVVLAAIAIGMELFMYWKLGK